MSNDPLKCDVCGRPIVTPGWAVQPIDEQGEPVGPEIDCCTVGCLRKAPSRAAIDPES